MWKRIDGFMRRLEFYFDGCDATLNGWEFLKAILLGVGICAAPFIIKAILLAVHFGGV